MVQLPTPTTDKKAVAGESRPTRARTLRRIVIRGVVSFVVLAVLLYFGQAGARYWLRSEVPATAPVIGLSLDRFFFNEMGVTEAAFEQAISRIGLHLLPISQESAGEPVDVVQVAELVALLDGIVIGGGGDVRADLYGGDASTTSTPASMNT